MGETIKQWLLKQRLSNYGYGWQDFRRMSSHKARVKAKLMNTPDAEIRRALANAGILGSRGRLTRRGGRVDYTVGQSSNEEVINMMQLGATKGKKSFWKHQERWSFR